MDMFTTTLDLKVPSSTAASTAPKTILIVEDELEIRQLIALHLRRDGYQVAEAMDGEQARQLLLDKSFDMVIVDWMLPGLSGVEITRFIRNDRLLSKIPILFVTAKTEPEDVARGLEAGADDYMTKPFDNSVLSARVKALLRRKAWLEETSQAPSPLLRVGALSMNTHTYEVTLDNAPMELTRSEFRLLQALLENQGRVLSRDLLIEQIQGEGVNVVGRTVDTHVFGLRKKLGSFSEMIETIRGVGYRVRYA